jgi:thiol-disulfide isomerase/thioredoxin
MTISIRQILLACSIFFHSFSGIGQDSGIKFESGLSWAEIQAKAKQENKPIFMDCYATWCGPCKYMDLHIYSTKEVGDYFNAHFINVKVQMDKTSKDSAQIKAWYPEADHIAHNCGVEAFPTCLFFSADGRPLHKIVGVTLRENAFIAQASEALDPESQYFTLLDNWSSHKDDSTFLQHTLVAIKKVNGNDQAHLIANRYLQILKDPIQKYTIDVISPFITSESDETFQFYLRNVDKIGQIEEDKGYVENTLSAIIFKEEISPLLSNKKAAIDFNKLSSTTTTKFSALKKDFFEKDLDELFQQAISREISESVKGQDLTLEEWSALSQRLKTRFPRYDCEKLLLGTEAQYLFTKRSWKSCEQVAISYIDRYGNTLNPNTINNYIWTCIFMHGDDKKILQRAIVHMENVIKATPQDLDNLDTYANLLYKIGKQKEAIRWENKAVEIAEKSRGGDSELKKTLEKMKKGEITWGDSAKA